MNPYRVKWISRVHSDHSLSTGVKSVADVLASAGVFGQVALTNWQNINRNLKRPPRDTLVHRQIEELQQAGYLGRYQGNKYNQSRGWRLYLPEEESNLFEFSDRCA
ncbi:hypothetical protein OCL88_20090 [Paenarthrobacter sp. PAE-2]|uniref:hypothetical protein n=1 Tax=Paenarthrobacter sp. PAE-2 TaxID=2982532 RepID=UPI0022324699|nr:hypothetical protein [Paenarthrobacter sp. PAE-2]MCW3768778.1 hypothetical protein [Paenarthrobacter sp. PAE-2]